MQGNNVAIKGSLTKDAEIRTTQSGRSLAIFSIAWNTSRKNESGEWENQAHFFDCKTWLTERQAAVIADQLVKGATVAITAGHLAQDRWQDQQGNNRSRVVLWLDDPINGLLIAPPRGVSVEPEYVETTLYDEDCPF